MHQNLSRQASGLFFLFNVSTHHALESQSSKAVVHFFLYNVSAHHALEILNPQASGLFFPFQCFSSSCIRILVPKTVVYFFPFQCFSSSCIRILVLKAVVYFFSVEKPCPLRTFSTELRGHLSCFYQKNGRPVNRFSGTEIIYLIYSHKKFFAIRY